MHCTVVSQALYQTLDCRAIKHHQTGSRYSNERDVLNVRTPTRLLMTVKDVSMITNKTTFQLLRIYGVGHRKQCSKLQIDLYRISFKFSGIHGRHENHEHPQLS